MRNTKIICTTGPQAESGKILQIAIAAGMDMARSLL